MNMKKFFTIILTAMLFTITAAAELYITFPSSEELKQEQYAVTISITDNPGFISTQFELRYDPKIAVCTKVVPGEAASGMLTASNPDVPGEAACALFSAAGTEETNNDGEIAVFVFEKKKIGNPGFSFSLTECKNNEGKDVPLEIVLKNEYKDTSGGFKGSSSKPNTINPDEKKNTPRPETDAEDAKKDETATEPKPDESSISFSDLSDSHWAKKYIETSVKRGLFNGYPDGTFRPDNNLTRAEFTAVLWKMASKPEAAGNTPFEDVAPEKWYGQPISYAYENGLVTGTAPNAFSPNDFVTREQAVTILFRLSKQISDGNLSGNFSDFSEISPYAIDAVNWAIKNQILTGTDSTHISPKNFLTRAELAALTLRYLNLFPNQRF